MCRWFVWSCLVQVCVGSRVLVVFPVPSRSHTVLGDSLVKTLLDAGHQVTYVRTYSSLAPSPALTNVDISSLAEKLTNRDHEDLVQLVRNPQPAWLALEAGATLAQKTLEHDAFKKLLHNSDLLFDVVVAEWFYSGLLAPLAFLFECPLIWYSSIDTNWMNLQLVHEPTSPAYSVDPHARRQAVGSYSFRGRLDRLRQQLYLTAWNYYFMNYVEASVYDEIFRIPLQLRGRYLPLYEDLVYNASMLFINSHPLLGQTLALPQNTKYIGGHHLEVPTKPLPENFKNLLDRSKNGLIYFTLGYNIKSNNIPDYMKRQLLDIFGQLEQTVLWEFEEHFKDVSRNVHIVKKANRASILSHPNTVLIISHGDSLAIMEAVYFGVPIIGIPIFGDQFLTMDIVAARGLGVRVGFTEYLAHKIKDAVNAVLGNTSYHINAKKASVVIQNPLISPQRELLHWIELVISRRVEHLRSPALQLSTFERLHLDIVAVIAMFLWFLTKVIKVIKVHWKSETEQNNKKNQ